MYTFERRVAMQAALKSTISISSDISAFRARRYRDTGRFSGQPRNGSYLQILSQMEKLFALARPPPAPRIAGAARKEKAKTYRNTCSCSCHTSSCIFDFCYSCICVTWCRCSSMCQ